MTTREIYRGTLQVAPLQTQQALSTELRPATPPAQVHPTGRNNSGYIDATFEEVRSAPRHAPPPPPPARPEPPRRAAPEPVRQPPAPPPAAPVREEFSRQNPVDHLYALVRTVEKALTGGTHPNLPNTLKKADELRKQADALRSEMNAMGYTAGDNYCRQSNCPSTCPYLSGNNPERAELDAHPERLWW